MCAAQGGRRIAEPSPWAWLPRARYANAGRADRGSPVWSVRVAVAPQSGARPVPKVLLSVSLFTACVVRTASAQKETSPNLLTNPHIIRAPAPWHTWARKGQPEFACDTTTGHGDKTSLRIAALEKGVDGSWLQGLTCEGGVPYTFAFWFRTDPPEGKVSFLAELNTAAGAYAGQHRREFQAEGAEWTRAAGELVTPPMATTVQFEVWVNLDDVGQGRAWFDDLELRVSLRPLVDLSLDAPLHHVLAPEDESVRFHMTQTNPRAPETEFAAELRDGDRLIAKRSGRFRDRVEADFPTTGLAKEGVYELSVTARAGGSEVFRSEEVLVRRKRPPSVRIGPHRELLVDGRPFFPLGVYWARKEDLKDVAANGFNCVHAWLRPNADGKAFLGEAGKQDLRVVLEMSDTLRGRTDLDLARERVEFVRSDPALLCYYPVDEPIPRHVDPAGMRNVYNLIKRLDPDHPVMYVQCTMNHLTTYRNATDIQAVDPYGSPDMVQQWMAMARASSQHRKPVWAVLGAFPYFTFGGLPTPEYVRAAAYTALVSGAKGILYFSYHFEGWTMKQSVLWEPLGRLNAEIRQLSPWLVAGDPVPVEDSGKSVLAAKFEGPDGPLLLAVNKSKSESATAKIELPGMRGHARSVFGDAVLPCREDLTFRLTPYGTAAWRLP